MASARENLSGDLSGERLRELSASVKLFRLPPLWSDCNRRCCWSLNRDFSGDLRGSGLIVYVLSLAFAANASAAAATFFEVFGFVVGLATLGFNGRGGGARSGSELSHLQLVRKFTFHCSSQTYMGTLARPESDTDEWCLRTSSRSRHSSLSTDPIVANRLECDWNGLGLQHYNVMFDVYQYPGSIKSRLVTLSKRKI